jgi:hypothetical protein
MRTRLIAAIGAGLLVALWGASAAGAGGRIPKHFAYAAEIRVTLYVHYAKFSREETYKTVCTDGNGVNHTLTKSANEADDIGRTVVFKHITVPIVSPSQLGKAAARLALHPTVTDPGRVTSDHSTYQLSGKYEIDTGCPGSLVPYDCRGTLHDQGGLSSEMLSTVDGFRPDYFYLGYLGVEQARPDSCSDGEEQIADMIGIDAGQASKGTWGHITLSGPFSKHDFYVLAHRRDYQFAENLSHNAPCPRTGQSSCTQSVEGTAEVKLHVLFYYYTKRSYAK